MTATAHRFINEYATRDGVPGYLGMIVDDYQIAGAVRQDDAFEERTGYRWHVWSPLLGADVRPAAVRSELDVRAWLNLLADLYEGKAK